MQKSPYRFHTNYLRPLSRSDISQIRKPITKTRFEKIEYFLTHLLSLIFKKDSFRQRKIYY